VTVWLNIRDHRGFFKTRPQRQFFKGPSKIQPLQHIGREEFKLLIPSADTIAHNHTCSKMEMAIAKNSATATEIHNCHPRCMVTTIPRGLATIR
jgi:hypothetical protein